MGANIILIVVILVYLGRGILDVVRRTNVKYLFTSFFIFTIPFDFVLTLSTALPTDVAGTLWPVYVLSVPVVLLLLFLVFNKRRKFNFNFSYNNWVMVIAALILLSLINPYNVYRKGTLTFALFFFQYIVLLHFLYSTSTKAQIIRGIFDGFAALCLLQAVLALCFPVLGIQSVIKIFHSIEEEVATRYGERAGAIGVFRHPGSLALYTIISSTFFLACYLRNYRKLFCSLILAANVFTLMLTYSRTSYLTFIIVMFAVYYIYKNSHKNIFSVGSVLKFIIPVAVVLDWVVFFSPFSDQFLKSDSSDQYSNRLVHWLMASEIFSISPFIGVGLNSHLAFLKKNFSLVTSLSTDEFFSMNPIHNIHLIIISEVGILGLVIWLMFIFKNINRSKQQMALKTDVILPATLIGLLLSFALYGITGWTPFSSELLPFFIAITFFTLKFRQVNTVANKNSNPTRPLTAAEQLNHAGK